MSTPRIQGVVISIGLKRPINERPIEGRAEPDEDWRAFITMGFRYSDP